MALSHPPTLKSRRDKALATPAARGLQLRGYRQQRVDSDGGAIHRCSPPLVRRCHIRMHPGCQYDSTGTDIGGNKGQSPTLSQEPGWALVGFPEIGCNIGDGFAESPYARTEIILPVIYKQRLRGQGNLEGIGREIFVESR